MEHNLFAGFDGPAFFTGTTIAEIQAGEHLNRVMPTGFPERKLPMDAKYLPLLANIGSAYRDVKKRSHNQLT